MHKPACPLAASAGHQPPAVLVSVQRVLPAQTAQPGGWDKPEPAPPASPSLAPSLAARCSPALQGPSSRTSVSVLGTPQCNSVATGFGCPLPTLNRRPWGRWGQPARPWHRALLTVGALIISEESISDFQINQRRGHWAGLGGGLRCPGRSPEAGCELSDETPDSPVQL